MSSATPTGLTFSAAKASTNENSNATTRLASLGTLVVPNSCLILIESFDDDLLPESPDPLLLTLPQAVTKTNANNNATIPQT